MNNQEIFNKVATHLLTQSDKALDEKGDCMYRGLNGTSCAAGCLIPDELYEPEMENESILNLANDFPDVKAYLRMHRRDTLRLIDRLQNVHDAEPVEYWYVALDATAADFDLNTEVLSKFADYV